MIAIHGVVTGRVQGVGFRWSTRHEARRVGVTGWVRNRSDGSVELHAEGDQAAVDGLIEWLRSGPPHSRVDEVRVEPAKPLETAGFDIVE